MSETAMPPNLVDACTLAQALQLALSQGAKDGLKGLREKAGLLNDQLLQGSQEQVREMTTIKIKEESESRVKIRHQAQEGRAGGGAPLSRAGAQGQQRGASACRKQTRPSCCHDRPQQVCQKPWACGACCK